MKFMKTQTPHIRLEENSPGFGKTVLMPGDPLRAKLLAEKYLENAILVNSVRGVNGYTGFYRGVKVSVMASGMGMPSIGIYSYELYRYFGVQNIIRIGSAGAISRGIGLRDIVAGMGACTNSSFAGQYGLSGTVAPICDYSLLTEFSAVCRENGVTPAIGSLFSSDTFYDDTRPAENWGKLGCLAVEMEAAALYCTAMRLGMRALAVCTVSDLAFPPFTTLSAEDREKSFTKMMELALDTAAAAEKLPALSPRE